MYLTFLGFNYLCFILIKYFMFLGASWLFHNEWEIRQQNGHHFWTQDSRKPYEEHKRKNVTVHMYDIVYVTVHNTVSHRRNDDVALTDEVSRSCWTKILMYCWSMTWQYINVPKISRMVHALHRIIFNQTASLFKSVDCSNRVVKPHSRFYLPYVECHFKFQVLLTLLLLCILVSCNLIMYILF